MSYTVVNPGGKQRPGTVTAASALLYLVAATQLASIVASLFSLGPIRAELEDVLAGQPGMNTDAVGTAMTVGIAIGVAISLIFVVGPAVLGLLVGKGKNPARIVTWVLAGIGVLCFSCNLASSAVSTSLSGLGEGAETADIQRRVEEAIPTWVNVVSIGATIVLLLALLAVIILLALPASNDFFRKEEEVWVPPTWPQGGAQPPLPPNQPPFPPNQPPLPPNQPPFPPAPPQP